MLLSLYVKNFAIIDNVEIEFKDKMTVLTGETGAGKSLIIDAIGLLFGDRASSNLVRFGEEKAIIEGVFTEVPKLVQELTNSNADDVLIIRREIYANGKSICKVNNQTITLSQLSEISEMLGDIHTQFDTQRLINPKNYLDFIDNEEVKELLINYQEELKNYNKFNKEYKDLLNRNDSDLQRLDFLKFQINEIETAKISISEEEELKQKSNYLMNYENLLNNLKEFIDYYDEESTLDNIYNSTINLKKLEEIDPKYKEYLSTLEDAYYQIVDVVDQVRKDFKLADFDESELEYINERLGLYSDFKRKYKKTTEEILKYYEEMKKEISNIENYDEIIANLEKKVKESYNKTLEIGKNIREIRISLAKSLEKSLIANLKDLKLKNTRFEIVFNDLDNITFKPNGIDEVDFLISFNIGEPLKPLSKVASGGELSRFMLALKEIISEKVNLQTIIFDEIDNGVSGEVAYSIANKIKSISKNLQVLCVTHLPQVAAISDHQINITKDVIIEKSEKRTITKIEELDHDLRVIEIAKMISNGIVTEASKNLAIELLKSSIN